MIAIQKNGEVVMNPPASTMLPEDGELVMLGSPEQRELFADHFGSG